MQYRDFITPNDDDVISSKDYISIQNAIKKAKETGCNKVVVPRFNKRTEGFIWAIEKTIKLASDIYLVFDNCHLRMADNTFCNMITNENCRTPIANTTDGTQHNIIIEGRGRAILDGGNYNGLCEENYKEFGGSIPMDNCTLMFANVDGFKITGLHITNQRYWGMNFLFCSNGRIYDIDFMADHTFKDENGVIQTRLDHNYPHSSICVKNADGIDLRVGCHDIIIENITGFTEDDTVALTGIPSNSAKRFYVDGLSPDIRNVIIKSINSATHYANVRLLNQGGIKLYNILIDGIMDSSKDMPGTKRGGSGVRIGDHHMYGERHATSDETYNITVRNVYSRAISPLNVVCNIGNFQTDNIQCFDRE